MYRWIEMQFYFTVYWQKQPPEVSCSEAFCSHSNKDPVAFMQDVLPGNSAAAASFLQFPEARIMSTSLKTETWDEQGRYIPLLPNSWKRWPLKPQGGAGPRKCPGSPSYVCLGESLRLASIVAPGLVHALLPSPKQVFANS